jgi:hypothetical protein
MTNGTYTPQEFGEALAQGHLDESCELLGMAKRSEDDPGAILFTLGVACAGWVKVPFELIGTVEHLGARPCGEHSHPLVRLTLHPPAGPESALYGLLKAALRGPSMLPGGQGRHPIDPLDNCGEFLELCRGFRSARERRACRAFVLRDICGYS